MVPASMVGVPSSRASSPVSVKLSHADVVAIITSMMPGSFLSPVAHGLLAEAHTALGDGPAADHERALTKLAFKSILDSGDGSEGRPWKVLRISDEYDVLRLLGRSSTQQELVERGGRRFDRHVHADASESCFDVTVLVGSAQ